MFKKTLITHARSRRGGGLNIHRKAQRVDSCWSFRRWGRPLRVQNPRCARRWSRPAGAPVWSWKEEKASWSKRWRRRPPAARRAETAAGWRRWLLLRTGSGLWCCCSWRKRGGVRGCTRDDFMLSPTPPTHKVSQRTRKHDCPKKWNKRCSAYDFNLNLISL